MKIKNLKVIPATGKVDNQFVGIKIIKNQIEFHYPESYTLSDSDDLLRKDILAILRTISLAKTQTSDLSSYNVSHKNDYVFPIESYLWIINDYLTYGKYDNKEVTYTSGVKGKINWKKTMQANPIVSNGNVIYTNIISEARNQKDNLITEIYFYCVQVAVDNIGWLYGISFDSHGVDYYKKFNKKLYIGAINTEITHTFDDQKKMRLHTMRNIITGLDEDMVNTHEVIYGVDSYEYVYERMIDSMFSNVQNIKDFYPNAIWDLVLNNQSKPSSKLRPDTVVIKDNKVYILDAKYYRYGTTFHPDDMPETTSIQKQITYGEYVKQVKKGKYDDVFSAFLLPYSQSDNIHKEQFNKTFEFIGIGRAQWIDNNENSKNIAAVLIDTKFLINNWLRKNDNNIISLAELIETKIKETKKNVHQRAN